MAHRQFNFGQVGRGRPSWVPQQPIEPNSPASDIFDQFCAANTFHGIMSHFNRLCDILEIKPSDTRNFYPQLKSKLNSWKAQSLWAKLDKRSTHRDYKKQQSCVNTRVLVIGAGPCGLRSAIEVALLGGKAIVVEKRDSFSRNNVLHLWPFLIHDLKALGAKKFFGKFCAGAIDHISIRTLQCILLKAALLLGVEVYPGISFEGLKEPPADQEKEKVGWHCQVIPSDHPVSEFEFDVLIGADGKRNTLSGFRRKEFRGKLAIAITANFINRHTQPEARVEEISGVAFIFNQKFFKDLNQKTGIDLENIVYYKDETHYFVMTAKKHSLLDKGVLLEDYDSTAMLLRKENVDQEALMSYAREAADVSTSHQLPHLDYAHNHYGQPDVAMFDFTSIYAAEHASRVVERNGHKLLMTLVGDSLLEPFWPTGSGCARGFLGAFDAAWMIKQWASGTMTPLEVMAERESVYQLLSQTTPDNLQKNFSAYGIDPSTRYPTTNMNYFKPVQVKNQYDGVDLKYLDEIVQISEEKSKRYEWIRDYHYLLKWYQKQLESYRNTVKILDLTTSWRNGLALGCLIHKYRPELLDIYSLDPNKVAENNQLVFDIAAKEFGIPPIMSGEDMAMLDVPDKLSMVSYLSQFYEYFRKESIRPAKMARTPETEKAAKSPKAAPKFKSPKGTIMSKFARARQKREEEEKENDSSDSSTGNRGRSGTQAFMRKKNSGEQVPGIFHDRFNKFEEGPKPERKQSDQREPILKGQNKVSALAKDLAIKFSGKSASPPSQKKEPKQLQIAQMMTAEYCYFCDKRVYLLERMSAEGKFFHRGCFRCDYCNANLRIGAYAFQKGDNGDGKFYCFQHYGRKRQPRKLRKRSFGDRDIQNLLSGRSAKPAGNLPSPPEDQMDSPGYHHLLNKTPERIEYTTESEMEESEFDQTSHNLSASLLTIAQIDDSDSSDSSTEQEVDDADLSDGELSWADLAQRSINRLKKNLTPKQRKQLEGETETETETDRGAGTSGDEGDWETDSDTEVDEMDFDEYMSSGKRPIVLNQKDSSTVLHLTTPPKAKPKETKPSPGSQAISANRMNFFSAPSEPVRIDAFSFLGISNRFPPITKPLKVEPAPEPEPEVEEKEVFQEAEEEVSDEEEASTEGSSDNELSASDEEFIQQEKEKSHVKKSRHRCQEEPTLSSSEEEDLAEQEYDDGTLKRKMKSKPKVIGQVVASQVDAPESLEMVALSNPEESTVTEGSSDDGEGRKEEHPPARSPAAKASEAAGRQVDRANKMAFFSQVAEPVRIDARELFGLNDTVEDDEEEVGVSPEEESQSQSTERRLSEKDDVTVSEDTMTPLQDEVAGSGSSYDNDSDHVFDDREVVVTTPDRAPLAMMDSESELRTSCTSLDSEAYNGIVDDFDEDAMLRENIARVVGDIQQLTSQTEHLEELASVGDTTILEMVQQNMEHPDRECEPPSISDISVSLRISPLPGQKQHVEEEEEAIKEAQVVEEVTIQEPKEELPGESYISETPREPIAEEQIVIETAAAAEQGIPSTEPTPSVDTAPLSEDITGHLASNNSSEKESKEPEVDKKSLKRVERTDTVIENVLESPIQETSPATVSQEVSTSQDTPTTKVSDSDIEESESSKLDSLVEVSIEDAPETSFTVDESFVTRRKRKRKESGASDSSSFTISTPSSSVKSSDSSISELEETKNSLSTDNTSMSFDRLAADVTTDDTLSLDNILADNMVPGDTPDATLINSCQVSRIDDTLHQPSANVTVEEEDSSLYFTPNSSGLDPKDMNHNDSNGQLKTIHIEPIGESKTDSDSISTSSENKSLNSSREEKKKNESPVDSPSRFLVDAKRRFFFEAAQPVRIDPRSVFEDLMLTRKNSKVVEAKNRENANRTKDAMQSNGAKWNTDSTDTDGTKDELPTTPSEGLPFSDPETNGHDAFYTPAAAFKTPAQKSKSLDGDLDDFKKPLEPRNILNSGAGDSDTTDEKQLAWLNEREKAREQARRRARLMSDEELGLDSAVYMSRKDSLKKEEAQDVQTHKRDSSDRSTKSEPSVAVIPGGKKSSQKKLIPGKSAPTMVSSPVEKKKGPFAKSPILGRVRDKKTKSPDVNKKSKSPDVREKKAKTPEAKSPDVKLRNKDKKDSSEKKEKKRSIFSILIPGKSSEKKEKDVKSPKSPRPISVESDRSTTTDSERFSKETVDKIGIRLRPKKTKTQEIKEEEKENRTSVYEEVKDITKGSGDKSKQTKQKLAAIAPGPSKPPEQRVAPKAVVDEFDTESLMSMSLSEDRMSLKSFQSQGMSDEDLAKMIRRQQRAAAKQRREAELKRLRMAQEIQRQLEEVEIKQREVEAKGVAIERALRGEAGGGDTNSSAEPDTMQEWFNVVHEKNVLVRYESELMVHARELELEDRHSRLEQQYRERMAIEDSKKAEQDKEDDQKLLDELLEVVEQRDALVALLEEDRLKEREEDSNIENLILMAGLDMSPMSYSQQQMRVHNPEDTSFS